MILVNRYSIGCRVSREPSERQGMKSKKKKARLLVSKTGRGEGSMPLDGLARGQGRHVWLAGGRTLDFLLDQFLHPEHILGVRELGGIEACLPDDN